jgi:outer membrane usher protein
VPAVASPAPCNEAGPNGTPEAAVLDVTVNGVPTGEPVLVLKGNAGGLYAPAGAFARWRLRPTGTGFTYEGTAYYPLSGVAGLRMELVEATQSLHLTADPALIEPTSLTYRPQDPGPMTPSAFGAFFNYDLLGQLSDGKAAMSGAVEIGAFTPHGVAVTGFVGKWRGNLARLTRLETNWTLDHPSRMRSLRVGDSISRGGVGGGPLRFGGFQVSRNFAAQPGFVTVPLPSLAGSAAVPSVVDIYVNNVLADRREVPPGPFQITGVPVVTGGGQVQLVIQDLLGREVLLSQSYYTAPELLRRGLHDYSYELGFLRNNFGRKSYDYGDPMLAVTHRYGISNKVTGELHAEATIDVHSVGGGLSVVVAGIGKAEASMAVSHSALGRGEQIAATFERRTSFLSFGIIAKLTSEQYVSVGSAGEHSAPATSLQLFAGLPLRAGSLGLSYLRQGRRGDERDAKLLSVNSSFRLGGLGTLSLAGRHNFAQNRTSAAEILLVVPLGPRTSGSVGAPKRRRRGGLHANIQRNLPAGSGIGFRAAAALGVVERLEARLTVQTGFGTYNTELSWVDGRTGLRMTASGGVGAVGDDVFVSRKLTESFATVQVGDYPGVKVYADNQLVGVTDASGRAAIPHLRPFDRNAIRIDADDLPIDAELRADRQSVRPHRRSGILVDFGVKRARAALLVLRLDDGGTVPAGSTLRLAGRTEEFVTAPGGEVYLTGLGADNKATATWSGGQCNARFEFTAGREPQPHLGEIPCRTLR